MIDPAKLAAFVVVTSIASAVPGPQMIYAMTQAAWRGPREGVAALLGLQIGNVWWYLLAALGLGTVAAAAPLAFTLLTLAGAGYLAWLGTRALRFAGQAADTPGAHGSGRTGKAWLDSIVISLGNPKALVYVLALLPPFVDPSEPVLPQIAVLAAIGMAADMIIGALYVAAGGGLSRMMSRPDVRRRLDQSVGAIFLALAAGICLDVYFQA